MGGACNCSKTITAKDAVTNISGAQSLPVNSEGINLAGVLTQYKKENEATMHRNIVKVYDKVICQMPGRVPKIKLKDFNAKDRDWAHFCYLLPYCDRLLRVHIWQVSISQESLDQLAERIGQMALLEYLTLGDINLGALSLASLRDALKELARMKELELTSNSLQVEHLQVLVPALLTLKRLTKLNLDENQLGNEGAVLIASLLGQLKKLRAVLLRYNVVGSRGFDALVQAMKRKGGFVMLEGNDLSDAQYAELEKL